MPTDAQRQFVKAGQPGRTWRGLGWLAGVFVGSLVVAAIVSPLVYWVVLVGEAHAPNELTGYLVRKSFVDFFDRTRWVAVVIGLPWLAGALGLASWRRLGLLVTARALRRGLAWAGVGALLVLLLAGLQVAFGAAEWRIESVAQAVLRKLPGALAAALLIALVEEVIFRGLVLRTFVWAGGIRVGLALGALFFAYVHFKVPDAVWEETSRVVDLGSGFYLAFWTLLAPFVDFDPLKFSSLALLGWTLGWLLLRDRSLWSAVGLHLGIVLVLQLYTKIASNADGPLRPWLGSKAMVDGVTASAALVLLAVTVTTLYRRGKCDAT